MRGINGCDFGIDWIIGGGFVKCVVISARFVLIVGGCVANMFIFGIDDGCCSIEWWLVVGGDILMSFIYGGLVRRLA